MRISHRNIVLVCLLLLSEVACAISFEVQVPMNEKATVGSSVQQYQPLTTGRFQTTVNPLDANGCAYSPGQNASYYAGPRRSGRDDEPTTPSDPPGMDTPVGDVPWGIVIMFALLLSAFRTYRYRNLSKL